MNKFVYLLAFVVCNANAIQFEESGSRLINGNLAAENQFPYMASLQLTYPTNITQTDIRGHRCSGVMVTLQHMVTAASCLLEGTIGGGMVFLNISQHRVFAGSSILANDNIPERTRQIANFTIHPEFIPAPANLNDIAIVTLISPYLNTTVVPLTLHTNATTFNPADFTVCTVAGWGSANGSIYSGSPQLRFADKYIYNHDLCTFLNNIDSTRPNIFSSMVCAASFDILSVGCTGDVGNPLVCNNMLTGIMFRHGNCIINSMPELYTRVSNYTLWIRSVTGSGSMFTPAMYMFVLYAIFQLIVANIMP